MLLSGEWKLILCTEAFETVVALPGFSVTASETTDFLYLALNIWINPVPKMWSFHDVGVHNWIQCIQTVIRHHSRFNINPFVVSRWALYTTALLFSKYSKVDIFIELFKALSNVDLYPAEGIMKTDASKQQKKEILLSWLIYSRTDPGDDNRFGTEHYSLTRYLPTCPLHILDLSIRFRDSRRDWIDINWLRFWLDNGVDPNRVGTWGTLGHFITGLFLGDSSSAKWKSEIFILGFIIKHQSQAKECLLLMKSYNADLNLRHPITHETIFEYACRLCISPKRTVGFIKALLDFVPPITITKYALISAFHLDKRHTAQERHKGFAEFGERPYRSLSNLLASELKHENFVDTASRDELSLGSLEHALEILENGLDPKNWDEFCDFYAKGVELPEVQPFEFWIRHISKTIPENLYAYERSSDELDSLDPFHVSADHHTEYFPFDTVAFMIQRRQAKIVLKYLSYCTHDKETIDMVASALGSP
ncbi:hypothetical protein TWF788_003939 [Orbilia oligospora]|uniref:Uncharacterized protein n=1 Tax=Orbilia oligospora TaxID=2813651 RepID=A0A7C8PZP5_ORBOL|nr:hypothetical protein TWF788_003939 [Orbilia oligospora]